MQIIIRNPLEQFEIIDLFSISTPLLGYKFALTNLGLYALIATSLILTVGFWIASENKKSLLYNYGSLIQESAYATIHSTVKDQIGSSNEKYLPFIFSLFIFILFNNLVGMVPYSFTPTSHLEHFIYSFFILSPRRDDYSNNSKVNYTSMIPIKIYPNPDTMKLDILKENQKSGIYRWVNTINGKSYIGSSVNISRRLYKYHLLT